MKIISQYKDFYDYLTGIYGVDEKIVLDRRKFDKFTPYVSSYSNGTKVQVFICDKGYDGYYNNLNNKWYWGKDLLTLLTPAGLEEFNNQKDKYKHSVHIRTEKNGDFTHFSLIPYDLNNKHNTKEKCPILIPTNSNDTIFVEYPPLKEMGIASILPAKDIFLMLSEWLAPKENHVDNRSNKEKIMSAGFDLKHSFRNTK